MIELSDAQENTLRQLPGLLVCLNALDEVVFMNELGANKLGFHKIESSKGVPIRNFPCKVAEYADIFHVQNQEVLNHNKNLKILDVHPFVNGEMLTLLTQKSRIRDDNNHHGVMVLCTQINRSMLLNISFALAQSDKKFRSNVSIARSYNISNQFKNTNLSARELEVLFYLVRGKVVSDISTILQISKRTIESYIENIKSKLACNNKAELIEKALDNNFIDFLPQELFLKNPTHLSLVIS